jgi:hypothetical protein
MTLAQGYPLRLRTPLPPPAIARLGLIQEGAWADMLIVNGDLVAVVLRYSRILQSEKIALMLCGRGCNLP